ncbi:unnamed protein product, partial [Laminaria digitata]
RDKWRRTPLHRAAKEGHKQVAAALLDSGAEINAQGDNNWTPLHCSSFHGKLEIVEMLLNHGADQGAKDVRGRTSAAVCDMGLYDVEQARDGATSTSNSVKAKILRLLEAASPRMQLEAPRAASMLVLPPSDTAITPAAVPAATGMSTPALSAPSAASGAAAAASGGTKPAGRVQSGDTHNASMAAASAASAAVAAETGVFALWDKTLSTRENNAGAGEGGMMEADWTDPEDLAWQEMWAMLHVPDPDDPDNNLYSEVKTLRKDVKRLRSDLNDIGKDASSYEGIFSNSVGPSAVGTNSGGDDNDSPDSAGSGTAAGVKLDEDEEEGAAAKRSAEWTSPGDDGVGDMPNELPPGKRQKSEETGGGGDGEAGTAAAANGMAFLKAPSGAGGDAAGGGGGGGSWGRGGEDKQEIARMGELELREQLAIQSRLVTDMMKEIALLKRHGSGSACG